MNILFVAIFVDIRRLTWLLMKVYAFFMRRYLTWAAAVFLPIILFFLGLKFGTVTLNWMGISFSNAKIISEVIQSLVEIIAIIFAGVWTYERFIKNREDYPYPKIEQRCEHHILENRTIYLNVFITITNQGKTKLDIDTADIIVRQVSPLSEKLKEQLQDALQNSSEEDIRRGNVEALFVDQGQSLGWETLGVREWKGLSGKTNELEPGQTREFRFDFLLLEDDVDVIEAISYFQHGESARWELRTLHSLEKQNQQPSAPNLPESSFSRS